MEKKPPPCKHCGSWHTSRASANTRRCRTCNREYRLYPYTPPPPPEPRYTHGKPPERPRGRIRRAPLLGGTVEFFQQVAPEILEGVEAD